MQNFKYISKKCASLPIALILITLWLCAESHAQTQPLESLNTPVANINKENTNTPSALLIQQLASSADLVAIVQVDLTSYDYKRGFPVDGYAALDVLITYKSSKPVSRIRIREKGLGQDLCYFPPTVPGQEGNRYLVFLAEHEDGDYRGHPLACSLQVLVTDDHAYALRVPLPEKVALTEQQSLFVQPMSFSDPSAITGSAELTDGRKEQLASQVDGIVLESGVKYTKGISIQHFRDLIGAENLKKPRPGSKY